jgi:hypothetical protein
MTPEKCSELLESIPDFDDLFDRKTTADVSALLDGFVNGGVTDPEGVSSQTEKYTTTSTVETDTEELNAVDAAFAELGSL